jgi:hypothetical protein
VSENEGLRNVFGPKKDDKKLMIEDKTQERNSYLGLEFLSSGYKEFHLLGCNTMSSTEKSTIISEECVTSIFLLKNKLSRKPT